MTFEISFLLCASILFHGIYKDVMISLVGNVLPLFPGSYFLAYPKYINLVLHFCRSC